MKVKRIIDRENRPAPTSPKLSVAFILLPDFTMLAFSGFLDVLRIAGDEGDRSRQKACRWTVIAPTMEPIRSNSGIDVLPWQEFTDPGQFDYLVVIGGRVEPQRHTDPRIVRYLKQAATQDAFIIGICTASFVLARAGLMDNRKCCVHWYHRAEFEAEFPHLAVSSEQMYIEDDRRITCPGGSAAADVALSLIARHCGSASARKAAAGMMMDGIRSDRTPQPHAEAAWYNDIREPLVRRAILIMDSHIHRSMTVANIAARLQVSENTLYRLFQQTLEITPARMFRMLRIAHGHWQLLHSNTPIPHIANYYQFTDASHFTRVYREFYGITPAQARKQGLVSCCKTMSRMHRARLIRDILSGYLAILG